jgi:hypothetical protein
MPRVNPFNRVIIANQSAPAEGSGIVGEIAKTAQTFGAIAQNRIETDASTFIGERNADFNVQVNDIQNQFRTEFADNPEGNQDVLEERIRSASEESFAEAPNAIARRLSVQATQRALGNAQVANGDWVNKQVQDNVVTRGKRASDAINLQAVRNLDLPMSELLDQINVSVMAGTGVLTGDKLQAQEDAMVSGAVSSRVDGLLAQGRTEDANSLIESQEFDESLGAAGVLLNQNKIQKYEQTAQKLAVKNAELRQSKPWKWVQTTPTVPQPPQLDMQQDPINSFIQRDIYLDNMQTTQGIELPFMQPQEVDALQELLTIGNARQNVETMSTLASYIPDERFTEVTNQLFQKQPSLGVAFGLANEDQNISEEIVRGQKFLDNNAVKMPPKGNFDMAFFEKINKAIPDPDLRRKAIEATRAAYASETFRQGDETGVMDSEMLQGAMDRIIGPVVGYNDLSTLSFRNTNGEYVDAEQFEDSIDNLTVKDIETVQGDLPRMFDGSPLNMRDIREYGEFVAVGDGRYLIKTFDEYAVDSKGQPFELRLSDVFTKQSGFTKPGFINPITGDKRPDESLETEFDDSLEGLTVETVQ